MKRVSSFCSSAISKHPIFSQFSQLSQHVDDRKPSIYFVVPPDKTVEECQKLNLGEMFLAAEAHFLNVLWIKDEECDNQELQEDGNVFIFDPFESVGFFCMMEKISSLPRVEILSPTVLRQVFNDPQQNTFETKECPVYTLAMKGMVICLSGFKTKEKKIELEKLVRWMNGSLTLSLTKAVTHVVTATAFTPKCIEANKEKIPIMTEEWVRQVWEDNQSGPVDASDSRYVKYTCPTFYNVNICLSQLTAIKKATLKSGIEDTGGTCTSDLKKKVTEILVIPNPGGDKFKFAQKWGVKCVTPQWVENSIMHKKLLPMDEYIVGSSSTAHEFQVPRPYDLGPITSTPAHSIMPDWNVTRCSAIIDDESRMVVEASKANFTRSHTEIHEETMSQLRAVSENKAFLDGCKIYLVEYENCDELKRELNKSGAVRLNQLCEGVTHVIVSGQKLPKSIQDKINEMESTPYVVTIDWVVQSAKDGNPADEEMFKFEPLNTICQETVNEQPIQNQSSYVGRVSATRMENPPREVSPNAHPANRFSGGGSTVTTTANASSNGKSTNGTTDGTETSSKTSTGTTANDTSTGSKSSSHATSDDSNEDSDATQEENTTDNQHVDGEESSPGLLVGITFKVFINDREERKFVQRQILAIGGSLVKENPEIAIFPPVCSPIDLARVDRCCTKYWLFECLESNALDIDNSFHHVPLPSFDGMEEVFRGVVIAVSQYPALEREYIIALVSALGGKCQDVFARKNSADGKNVRSTHLICKNMDTDKAKAARKWNVPAVVAEWVTDSFIEQKRLDENKYDPALVNTTDERTVFMPTPQRRRTVNASGNNNNMSTRTVYPPSTQKGGPNILFKKNNNKKSVSPQKTKSEEKNLPLEPKPSTFKAGKQGTSNEVFRAPASPPPSNATTAVVAPSTSTKALNQPTVPIVAEADKNDDSFLRSLPDVPPQEEIDRKMAELKAMFPYSDESYNQLLEDIQARGIDLDQVSPFTSFEEARLCNPDPDSPLLCGLPRHESRALKEQLEIALNRSPNIPKIKVKTPDTTPLREIVRRFNAMNSTVSDSPPGGIGATSTPKEDLRRRATMNRLSQGNLNISLNSSEIEEDRHLDPIAGIKKLRNKRPSDSPPEDEESKSSKRARKSSDDNSDDEEISKKSGSPNENHIPKQTDNEKPSTSKKPTSMQRLTNVIAESESNLDCAASDVFPIKRRSGDMLVPHDEVQEEIERPHLSWVENDDDENQKKSTVKKVVVKPRIAPEPAVSAVEPEPEAEGGRKRSSRLRKTPSVVGTDEGSGRVTRQTRNRSNSKSRKEDSAPLGHQPIKISEGKKSKKKKSTSFPIELPDNPVFGLSSLDPKDKNEATRIITALGGTVSKASNFDLNCSAIITTRLLRSEKILGCIASGKYLLKQDYLSKSEEAGHFLPIDETFLWHESNINEEKERELARASYGWLKLQMEKKDRGPMNGMKFYIVDQATDKVKAFERLIMAGGGDVVTDMKLATCVIKDDKSNTVVPEGITVENPMYLNTLILTLPSQ